MLENSQLESIQLTLEKYELGSFISASYLTQGYANENLMVTTSTGKVLYRICHQQPMEMLEYEVRLMFHLKNNGIKAAFPIPDRSGNFIQPSPEGDVMIYDFVAGGEPDLNHKTVTQMGMAVAKISLLAVPKALIKHNVITLESCRTLTDSFDTCVNQMPDVFNYFKEQTSYLTAQLSNELPKGIVHGDLFPNNTLFKNNQLVAMIDFEEACVDVLLFDVGMTINGFCFVDNVLQTDLLKQFLLAYNQQRMLTDAEWQQLPTYMQWCSHGMLSWHLQNDLLNTHNQVQHDRVIELMQRTQWMRQHEDTICRVAEVINEIKPRD